MSFASIATIIFATILSCGTVEAFLLDNTHLSSSCYNVPKKDFGYTNNIIAEHGASPYLPLHAGDQAIDFSIPSIKGESHIILSKLLLKKPVVLLWGMVSCPVFRGYDATENTHDYIAESKFVEKVKDDVYVVHIIGPEPHPVWPYANTDKGKIWMYPFSTIKQPQTFEERYNISVVGAMHFLNENVLLGIDFLDGVGDDNNDDGGGALKNNPVWCSYAHGSRAAIYINQKGYIKYTQSWFDSDDMYEFVKEELSSSSSSSSTKITVGDIER